MSNEKESFEDWAFKQDYDMIDGLPTTQDLRNCWNHQQKKIEELEKENKFQAEVICDCGEALEKLQSAEEEIRELAYALDSVIILNCKFKSDDFYDYSTNDKALKLIASQVNKGNKATLALVDELKKRGYLNERQ